MAFLDPHAVTGGTGTAAQQRREVYKQCKGNTGVDHVGDLKVVAVPGSPGVAGISVGGGSVAVESRREAYSILNLAMDGDALVDVPSAGSGGATHYVIVEVHDPEFDGQEVATVPQVVSSLSGRTRPFLPLARIDLEPGESFDATSEVTDLRVVAVPRKERHLFAYNLTTADGEHNLTNDTDRGQLWPDLGIDHWRVDVPEWATHAIIVVSWSGVRIRPVAGRWGRIWARIGINPWGSGYPGYHIDLQRVQWNLDDFETGQGIQREFWSAEGTRPVPEAMRGATNQPVRLRGMRASMGSSVPDSGPRLQAASSIKADIEFVERPS